MSGVLGSVSCDLDPKVKGQIMYVLENASPHNVLEVATSRVVNLGTTTKLC